MRKKMSLYEMEEVEAGDWGELGKFYQRNNLMFWGSFFEAKDQLIGKKWGYLNL